MEKKLKGVVVVIFIGLAVLYYVFPLFYEAFDYYPPIKEDMPYKKTVQVWNVLTNQRVTLNAEVPSIPVNYLPIYQGKSSSRILNVSFTGSNESFINSSESYDNNYTGEIDFLVVDNEIAESRFNLTDSAANLQPMQTANLSTSGKYIVQQIKNRNFATQEGNIPMFSLGRVQITGVKLVYFNGFDTYPYRYEGQTTYYPAWKLTVETSNYEDKVLLIKAF